tara:strand:- start:226 stop:390 length:165 start_codon:yes stop_codon:yes gene_type:complete
MKFDINEIHFVKSALEVTTIKVSDAKFAGDILTKLDKEFQRLQKLESKASGVAQ